MKCLSKIAALLLIIISFLVILALLTLDADSWPTYSTFYCGTFLGYVNGSVLMLLIISPLLLIGSIGWIFQKKWGWNITLIILFIIGGLIFLLSLVEVIRQYLSMGFFDISIFYSLIFTGIVLVIGQMFRDKPSRW